MGAARSLGRLISWLAAAAGKALSILVLFVSLLLAVSVTGCGQKDPTASQAPPATPVKTMVSQSVFIPDATEYLATLKSRHSTALNPQVEGQVTRISVKSGDRVSAGAPLMQIDPLKQQATVGSQDAARAAQVANVQFAQVQWERAKKLYDAGVTSKQDFDQAQTALDTAREQLKSLEAQLQEQQVQLHYYLVVAPTGGIIGDIPVRVGDRVTTSTLLTTVDEPGSLDLYVYVPVERSKDLKMGQPVQILDTPGKVVAESKVDFISPQVENDTQSILVKSTVKNSSATLRTSEFTRARIVWSTHQGPVIPVLAVSRISGQFFAFVVEGSGKSQLAHQKMIRVGDMVGNNYAVLDGIKAGDRVVIEGAQNLVDGASVTEAPPQSSPGAPQP
ncbi:MAG: efflux RND transporter periplasmic adaptor subunit [Candidatus Acidiferrales bacterium]